jgi:hypothetical protein
MFAHRLRSVRARGALATPQLVSGAENPIAGVSIETSSSKVTSECAERAGVPDLSSDRGLQPALEIDPRAGGDAELAVDVV